MNFVCPSCATVIIQNRTRVGCCDHFPFDEPAPPLEDPAPWQKVINDYPPLWYEINAAFKVGKQEVIFSFGPVIYNPTGAYIPPQLMVHEAVHGIRQGTDRNKIYDWWKRYIDSPKFRLAEEVPAHQAEYKWLKQHGNRQQRRQALKQVSQKLSSPLYGRMIKPGKARDILAHPMDLHEWQQEISELHRQFVENRTLVVK